MSETETVKFGNEAWFKKLNEMVVFPAIIAFYMTSEKSFHTMVVKTKATGIGNIKYNSVAPPWHLDEEKCALCCVKKIDSDQEYYNELVSLSDTWGGALREQS